MRLLAGILLGALILPASVMAGAVQVRNPMQADLDAAFYSINNVSELRAANIELGTNPGNFGCALLRDGSSDTGAGGFLAVCAGTQDPSTGLLGPVTPGSLYLRHNGTAGEVWAKTGPANTDWTQL